MSPCEHLTGIWSIISIIWLSQVAVRAVSGRVVKLGGLYVQKGHWYQDGVVLLLYKTTFHGTLFRITTRVGLLHTLPIQTWRDCSNSTGMYFIRKHQWLYLPKQTGERTAYLNETASEIPVIPDDYVGFFIAVSNECPLEYELIANGEPGIAVYGSNYLPDDQELQEGRVLAMSHLGYRLKYAIEFYFYTTDSPTTTPITTRTITSATTTERTTADTATTEWRISLSPEPREILKGNIDQPITKYISGGIVGCVLLVALILCLVCCKKRNRETRNDFTKTENPIYRLGDEILSKAVEQGSDRQINRCGTVSSEVYDVIDESRMMSTERHGSIPRKDQVSERQRHASEQQITPRQSLKSVH